MLYYQLHISNCLRYWHTVALSWELLTVINRAKFCVISCKLLTQYYLESSRQTTKIHQRSLSPDQESNSGHRRLHGRLENMAVEMLV